MHSTRTTQLLQAIVARHRDLMCLDGSFLTENEVTASECDIFYVVADILAGYLALPAAEQIRIRLLGSGQEPGLVNFIADNMKAHTARAQASEQLGQLITNLNHSTKQE